MGPEEIGGECRGGEGAHSESAKAQGSPGQPIGALGCCTTKILLSRNAPRPHRGGPGPGSDFPNFFINSRDLPVEGSIAACDLSDAFYHKKSVCVCVFLLLPRAIVCVCVCIRLRAEHPVPKGPDLQSNPPSRQPPQPQLLPSRHPRSPLPAVQQPSKRSNYWSLSQWHKQASSSTSAAHGEKSCQRSRPAAAAAASAFPLDDQRRDETFPFYGGLAHRSPRIAVSSPEQSRGASASPPSEQSAMDAEYETWINAAAAAVHWPRWRSTPPRGDLAAPTGASTGERPPGGEARTTATTGRRTESDESGRYGGAGASATTVHDVCYKINYSGEGSCGGVFAGGARGHSASGGCVGRPPQPSPTPSKPCDHSSISVSSINNSNSNRGGSRPPHAASYTSPAAAVANDQTLTLTDIDWTNATSLGGASDLTNTIMIDDPQLLWLLSPATSHTSSNNNMAEPSTIKNAVTTTAAIENSIDCRTLLEELSSPVSLHEEIEQLSSGFDCDASNHLVARNSPYLAADGLEPVAPNIFRWLQDDTGVAVGGGGGALLLDIATTQHPFLGAAATITNTTTTTPPGTTAADHHQPQRDHNYHTMKRRLQAVDGKVATKRKTAPPTALLVVPAAPTPTMTMTTTTTPTQAATTLNTPDLTNDILDLEDGNFDLLSFIGASDESLEFNVCHAAVEEKPTLDLLAPATTITTTTNTTNNTVPDGSAKPPTAPKGEPEPPGTTCPFLALDSLRLLTDGASGATSPTSPAGSTVRPASSRGRRLSSASSACGDSSSDVSSSTAKAPKRRGRPPKVAGTVRDRAQYQHLSDADWRYREQRDKNNEASRKSRINRKDREQRIEQEADQLNAQHQKLAYEERHLRTECRRWRKAVMKLALL